MRDKVTDIYERSFGGEPNLSPVERAVSAGFGLVMAAAGLGCGGVAGTLMGLAGGALALRGVRGHCPVKAMIEDRYGAHRLDRSRGEDQLSLPPTA